MDLETDEPLGRGMTCPRPVCCTTCVCIQMTGLDTPHLNGVTGTYSLIVVAGTLRHLDNVIRSRRSDPAGAVVEKKGGRETGNQPKWAFSIQYHKTPSIRLAPNACELESDFGSRMLESN